jgi:hypothetical protein
MAQHPIRLDRLDRGSVFLIVSEGQPADEYTVPVGFGHHIEGDTRWTVRLRAPAAGGNMGFYDAPGPERGRYFRSWQDVAEFAEAAVGGHWHGAPVDLVPPIPIDVVAWARQAEHDTAIRYDGLAEASETIRRQREQQP